MSDLHGKSLGRYRIVELIGAGGMGQVYRARDDVLQRDVAVKVLPLGANSDPTRLRRFEQEARATSALNHPNILAIYDFGEYEGAPYAVTEFLEGRTLREEMERSALSVRTATGYAAQVAQGLSAAHEKGIIHRDLKPENLFVTADGRVKILDFGIAKLLGPDTARGGASTGAATQTEAGVVLGTTGYMAPEQIRGEAVAQRADIFALGCVLYEMLAGRRAFAGRTAADTMTAVLTKDLDPPSTVNKEVLPELDAIVQRCLAKSPRERYQSSSDLASELERLSAASGHGPKWRGVATRGWLHSQPVHLAVAAGAVLAIGATIIGIAHLGNWRWPAQRIPVVAVLPSRNLSEDTDEAAFVGIAFGEELVTRLSQLSGLRLVPWLTTRRFADPNQQLKAVGRELGADKLVLGAYRSDGERVHLTLTLVDSHTGLQDWAREYEDSVGALLSLQQNAAMDIASRVGGGLSASDRVRLSAAASQNPEAYEYYLRGANFMYSEEPQSQALAGPLFEQALELDPNLAVAWVGLGAVKTDLYFRGMAGVADIDAADRAYRRALALNPRLYSAAAGLARVAYERRQFEEALKIGKDLARWKDDPAALWARGVAYTLGGLPDRAVPILDRVLEIDPASQGAAFYRVVAECWSGHLSEAVAHAKSYISRFGEDPEIYTWLGVGSYALGDGGQARVFLLRSLELFGDAQSDLYSAVITVDLLRALGEGARSDSLASHWFEILDSRLRANPDNLRARGFRATLAVRLRLPNSDQYLNDEHATIRLHGSHVPRALLVGGSVEPRRVGQILASLQDLEPSTEDYVWAVSGLWRLAFGTGYKAVEKLPEFRAYLASVQRHHAELVAKYQ